MKTPGCLHCWTQIPQIFLSWSLSCLKFLWMWRAHVWESVAKQSKPYIKYDKDGQTIVLCPDIYITLYIYISISNFIYSNNFIFKNILLELIDIDLQMHLALIGQTSAPRHELALTLNRNYRRADSSFWFEGFLRFQHLVQHYYDSYKMFIHLIPQKLCCTTLTMQAMLGHQAFQLSSLCWWQSAQWPWSTFHLLEETDPFACPFCIAVI